MSDDPTKKLPPDINDLATRLERLETTVDARLKDTRPILEAIIQRIESLATEISELRAEVKQEINALRAENAEEFNRVREEMRHGFRRVERRITLLDDRVLDVELRQRDHEKLGHPPNDLS